MAISATEVGAGVATLLTMFRNNGFPKIAVSRVTAALIIATKIGVSNFFSGFFSRSDGGSAGFPLLGIADSFETGEWGSESGIIDHRRPFLWIKYTALWVTL